MSREQSTQGAADAILPGSPCVLFRRADGNTTVANSTSRINLPYPNISYELRSYSPVVAGFEVESNQPTRFVDIFRVVTKNYSGWSRFWAPAIFRSPREQTVPPPVFRTRNFIINRSGSESYSPNGYSSSSYLSYSETRTLRWSPVARAWVWDGTASGEAGWSVSQRDPYPSWNWKTTVAITWTDGVEHKVENHEALSGPDPDDVSEGWPSGVPIGGSELGYNDDLSSYLDRAYDAWSEKNGGWNGFPQNPEGGPGWANMTAEERAAAMSQFAKDLMTIAHCTRRIDGVDFD
ncbi:hypothetical protein [Geminisphaera colitermitum]|uniref:hypothetical protein n=1 Tax=Geminisphaera colitermitum TaxID=1148786 RepID=UPI000158C60C|nr:hypothetical protein [Geminisphaera colitermitum]